MMSHSHIQAKGEQERARGTQDKKWDLLSDHHYMQARGRERRRDSHLKWQANYLQ